MFLLLEHALSAPLVYYALHFYTDKSTASLGRRQLLLSWCLWQGDDDAPGQLGPAITDGPL